MNFKKLIIICTAILIVVFSNLFVRTKGLVDQSGNTYVSVYMSSGSDDDVCIEIAEIFFIPFIVFVFTIKRKIFVWEFILGNIILLLQLFSIIIIEVGSITKTIEAGNIPLLLWCISYFCIFVELYAFFIYERVKRK